MTDSQPEPDLAIVRGSISDFNRRHPAVSNAKADRADLCRIYARAGINEIWIVNLPDRCVEVYTQPTGPCESPRFGSRVDYADDVMLSLDIEGTLLSVPVEEMLP